MNYLFTLLIALTLSVDSFAVSVCSGLSLSKKQRRRRDSWIIASVLGIVQAVFALIGWGLGESFKQYIEPIDHWVAFILLFILGVKMIKDGLCPVEKKRIKHPTHWRVLIPLAVATSIDAFVVGIGFSLFVSNIVFALLAIALITFIVSMLGIYMGRKMARIVAGKAEIAGGFVLIAIGSKILIEHLVFL